MCFYSLFCTEKSHNWFCYNEGLTHGTITDDSDVWVFGGQRIYKNFFNQDKHCEVFSAADISKHFGLSREKLILLAMLTGSDYTDGVDSVGPVTGLEVLAEFPGQGLEPLNIFKSWWDEAHKNLAMPPGRKKLKTILVSKCYHRHIQTPIVDFIGHTKY